MVIAHWSSRYETGIGIIDTQHQSLFEALNQLGEAFKAGTAAAQVKQTLDFLVQYTLEHFQAEEAYMRELGYPGLKSHMALHADLMVQARALQAQLETGQTLSLAVAIFLADWLRHHIDQEDMAYVTFVKKQHRP